MTFTVHIHLNHNLHSNPQTHWRTTMNEKELQVRTFGLIDARLEETRNRLYDRKYTGKPTDDYVFGYLEGKIEILTELKELQQLILDKEPV